MREVGLGDLEKGLEITFNQIVELSANCKYKDCQHGSEDGCAVIEAVEQGIIEKSSYKNYLKLEREKQNYELNLMEKRKKDRQFGKMFKRP